MSRLASQAKLGYYKTPLNVVELIREAIFLEKGVRLLDPCCADGEALSIFAKGTPCETFGIEIEKDRFCAACERLDRVLHSDALVEAVVSDRAFDLLWLNPPYDFDDADATVRAERYESFFLERFLPALAYKGVLVLIIPYKVLKMRKIRALLAGLSELKFYKFPDPEYNAFNQIVVIGRKAMCFASDYHKNIDLIEDQNAHVMPTVEEMPPIAVEVAKRGRLLFKANHIDPQEVFELTEPLKARFFRSITPASLAGVRPLMPLRQGHMAMLLAAGFINGELKNGDKDLVIKGSVDRKTVTSSETTETHQITRRTKKVIINVRALNMNTGEIESIAT